MTLPERELGVEDVISWSLKFYKNNFAALFAAFFVASIPLMFVEMTVLEPMLEQFNAYLSQYVNVSYPDLPQPDTSQIPLLFLGIILHGLMLLLAYSITVTTTSNQVKMGASGQNIPLSESTKKYGKLIVASIALGAGLAVLVIASAAITFFLFTLGEIAALLGMLLFLGTIVGSIYISIRLSLFNQVVLLEDLGVVDSVKRSFTLLKGRVIKMIILGICVWLITIIPGVIMNQITSGIALDWVYLSVILSSISTALAAPLSPIAMTVYYHSLRSDTERPAVPAPPTIIMTPG
jgi:hypothetical protein